MSKSKSERVHDAYPLKTVAASTGLTPDLIRAWEKRYAVVEPVRGPRGARLYTSADIEHLSKLATAVRSGRAIGDVARLAPNELDALVYDEPSEEAGAKERRLRGKLASALRQFDAAALRKLLGEQLLAFGGKEFVTRVVAPLLDDVGRDWFEGRLTIAHEHLLSATLRELLAAMLRSRAKDAGPTLVLATPQGERHEFGLLMVGIIGSDVGLRICNLGIDIPAEEIVAAVRSSNADVLGISAVDPGNRERTIEQLQRLERAIDRRVELWLGGAEATVVTERLDRSRVKVVPDLNAAIAEMQRVVRLSPGPSRAHLRRV